MLSPFGVWLESLWSGSPAPLPRRSGGRTVRPGVEELEGRLVLDASDPASLAYLQDAISHFSQQAQQGFTSSAQCRQALTDFYNSGLQYANANGFGDLFASTVGPAYQSALEVCKLHDHHGGMAGHGKGRKPHGVGHKPGGRKPQGGKATTTRKTLTDVGRLLDRAEVKYGLPTGLLKAMAWHASRWDARMRKKLGGRDGENRGLFGMNTNYWKFARSEGVFNARKTIDFVARYLATIKTTAPTWRDAVEQFFGNGDEKKGAAAADHVDQLLGQRPWAAYFRGSDAMTSLGGGTTVPPVIPQPGPPRTPENGYGRYQNQLGKFYAPDDGYWFPARYQDDGALHGLRPSWTPPSPTFYYPSVGQPAYWVFSGDYWYAWGSLTS